jgi:hypothetical protein
LDITAWPDEPWRTRQHFEATKKFQPSASGTMLAPRGILGTQGTKGPKKILRDPSLTTFKPYGKVEMDEGKKKCLTMKIPAASVCPSSHAAIATPRGPERLAPAHKWLEEQGRRAALHRQAL